MYENVIIIQLYISYFIPNCKIFGYGVKCAFAGK